MPSHTPLGVGKLLLRKKMITERAIDKALEDLTKIGREGKIKDNVLFVEPIDEKSIEDIRKLILTLPSIGESISFSYGATFYRGKKPETIPNSTQVSVFNLE